ncbi:bifunctional [glutamate--ammonia ligase]-adenylyl-L-tyrosine phosphorylase/[glutamate--ammonia-ligase] adenylyltransferase [Acidithiobacillus sulfuriphilus]|uniref:Bifunctional glutamine synthetase adenylyltransferase/adenylyl-removing enzyme n=2 Tax=Acidithiobacillus sulfuriphilus TaxID=1867749 RepID=A0A3M8R9T5_9PROT|nr:bifunctional [glutamate--ammonia ligase]-adenylyl-L-tyrosine phosphorylase/[glutamate--ammonia-ligase] adenylyltransferase [Acidithiobacillus sulfuriphilus]RNF65347.1 bifunctional [glutamate--ammonia ligase]-adenylyl-L-tyrosine phosphorylase/[glutamate--ammonia-ligase] adenylyltransferase [Acidithiobacillus sulfuriphilus]
MSASTLPESMATAIAALPVDGPATRAALQAIWEALAATEQGEVQRAGAAFGQHSARILCISPFARALLLRHPHWLPALAQGQSLSPAFPQELGQDALFAALRQFRNRRMVEILWQDRLPGEHYEETVRALSQLAEDCLAQALSSGERVLQERHGRPRNAQGEAVPFVVLGMGKLGGGELNLSSDIDLLFVYGEGGATDGPLSIENGDYFQRLGRWIIQALDTPTADGFCFRVDMRLRPFGDAGPLCLPAAAMEQYYQVHGRGWERYALIKARPVAGELRFGAQVLHGLRPFVYRRYLDFTALDALREVKALMDAEQQRGPDDIKKGLGGIREIEFIVQSLQLIHGGRNPTLRGTNTLAVLHGLHAAGLLPADDAALLHKAYLFYRNTEHCLQMVHDRQTQRLPQNQAEWERLAYALQQDSVATLQQTLQHFRRQIHERFALTLAVPASSMPTGADPSTDLWRHVQQATLTSPVTALLAEHRFSSPDQSWERLWRFAHSRDVQSRLSASGRARVDRMLPLVLGLCRRDSQPDALLDRFLQIIEAILSRANYLALLAENPIFLGRLAQLLQSPWLARELAHYPVLLDDVLSQPRIGVGEWPSALAAQLLSANDLEERMDALRRFKNAEFLRLAAAHWMEQLRTAELLTLLSGLAELCLRTAVRWAEDEMLRRHGQPRKADGQPAQFGVIALGKLGGKEMGFASDLDLVYLYDAPLDGESDGPQPLPNPAWFARLGQRLIHILGTLTRAGTLYQIDMRLRPSGQSGPLVTTLQGFADYQRQHAWTWEHQALTRARAVAGDSDLGQRFAQIRQEILCQSRDLQTLAADVRAMRARIHNAKIIPPGSFHLKLSPGGLTDIEFLVQFAMLGHCHSHPELAASTSTVTGIRALAQAGLWQADAAAALESAWILYRTWETRLWLKLQGPSVTPETTSAWQAITAAQRSVMRVWQQQLGETESKN